MKRKTLAAVIVSAGLVLGGTSIHQEISNNKILLTNPSKNNTTHSIEKKSNTIQNTNENLALNTNIQIAYIGSGNAPALANTYSFATTTKNNETNANVAPQIIKDAPLTFASPLQKKLYEYLLVPKNQALTMQTAIDLHNGNPANTCVLFQSSALRANGFNIPLSTSYTTEFMGNLLESGWQRHTDFNNLQPGDICFASTYHTFMFMGWYNKAEKIAYVMGNESFMDSTHYKQRHLNGLVSAPSNDNNGQFKATSYYTYSGKPKKHLILSGKIIGGTVNVMSESNGNGHSLGQVYYGDNVVILEQQGHYFKINKNGLVGWVYAVDILPNGILENYITPSTQNNNTTNKNIKPVKPIVENKPVAKPTIDKILGTTTITSPIGLWELSAPSMNGKHITVIPYNTKVNVYGEKDGWYEVEYNGVKGWSFAKYTSGLNKTTENKTTNTIPVKHIEEKPVVKPSKPTENKPEIITKTTAVVNSNIGLWLLNSPSMNGGHITVMPYNSNLKVLGHNGNWTKVNFNGTIGWCYTQYITEKTQTTSKPATPQIIKPEKNKPASSKVVSNNNSKIIGTTTITSTIGLWQLSTPSMNGKHITVIPYNTKVNVYAEKNGWYEVEYNGVKGWSFAKYTSGLNKNLITQNPTQSNQQIKEVISPVGLWLLQAPYLSATGIEIMPYKANLKVLAQNGNWTKVDYNGTIGWCYTQYTQNI